ncbi:translocase of chloroplast 90, chloroplastic-like isoform X2 [Wolffia australiana]
MNAAQFPHPSSEISGVFGRMKTFKEWISRQLETNSLLSSVRPLSFIDREPTPSAGAPPSPSPARGTTAAASSDARRVYDHLAALCHGSGDPLAKVELIQVQFLRLALRLGIPPSHRTLEQVLHRLHLAKVIRSGDADRARPSLPIAEARAVAVELELAGRPDLDLSFKILLLGTTGTGKSATINSIFSEAMAETSAFEPATRRIREISGASEGISITAVDTPGLRPSSSHGNQRHNRRVLLSIRRFFSRRPPPDVILFCDRLDGTAAAGDLLLVKLVTEVLGSSIWYNSVLVFSHAAAVFEGPLTRQVLANQRANSIRRCINQAISDARLEVPVLSVENGQSHGHAQSWRPELLFMCASMKVLADVNALFHFRHTVRAGRRGGRAPSLPHLLSSLLQPRGQADGLAEELCNCDNDDDDNDDEHDALPPFRALTRAQFEKLSKTQQNAYLDELDYRETLLLKKQIKEEFRRRQRQQGSGGLAEQPEEMEQAEAAVVDMAIPPSFDIDCMSHRYRCLVGDNRCVARPVLDSHGWDHDVGFDGVSVEVGEPGNTFLGGQLNKDKKTCSLVAEGNVQWSLANWFDLNGSMDLQAAAKGSSVMTVRAAAGKVGWGHAASCGMAMTASPGGVHAVGFKLEDSVLVARQAKVRANAGLLIGRSRKLAWGGGMETTLVGREFPAREDRATMGLTLLAFDREVVLGGTAKAEFRPRRGMRVAVDATLNSRQLGRVSLKTTGNLNLAILTIIPLLQAILRRRGPAEWPPLEEEDEEEDANWRFTQ